MSDQDKWVDDILTSIDKIDRAQPRADLLGEILNKLPQTKIIPLRKLYWVAAASVILISVNVATIATNQSSYKAPKNQQMSLTTNYSLYD